MTAEDREGTSGAAPIGAGRKAGSAVRWTGVGALTAAFGTVSLASSIVDGRGRTSDWCMRLWSRASLAAAGVRVEARGMEHIRTDRPQILFSSHSSFSDICILGSVLPVPYRWLARKEIFRVPFIGWHLWRSGHLRIDRGDRESARRMFQKAVDRVRAGTNVLVFPEGTRNRDGALRPFKKGVFHFALDAGVPAVPIMIFGSHAVLPRGSAVLGPGSVTVVVGEPIETAGLSRDDLGAFMDKMRAAMLSLRP